MFEAVPKTTDAVRGQPVRTKNYKVNFNRAVCLDNNTYKLLSGKYAPPTKLLCGRKYNFYRIV